MSVERYDVDVVVVGRLASPRMSRPAAHVQIAEKGFTQSAPGHQSQDSQRWK